MSFSSHLGFALNPDQIRKLALEKVAKYHVDKQYQDQARGRGQNQGQNTVLLRHPYAGERPPYSPVRSRSDAGGSYGQDPSSALPPDVLLDAMFLWGVRLSGMAHLTVLQSQYLDRAIAGLGRGLEGNSGCTGSASDNRGGSRASVNNDPRHRCLCLIQAETLIALYFYSEGRFLEGKVRADSAVALTLAAGLHQLKPEYIQTDIDEEMVNTFWSVVNLDRCWSVVLGASPAMAEDEEITTPLPRMPPALAERFSRSYQPQQDREMSIDIRGYNAETMIQTRGREVPGPGVIQMQTQTWAALSDAYRARVSGLLSRAAKLVGRYTPGQVLHPAFLASFADLHNAIKQFIAELIRIGQNQQHHQHPSSSATHPPLLIEESDEKRRKYVTTYSLAMFAMIVLHERFAGADAASRAECVRAAEGVAWVVKSVPVRREDVEFFEPVVGVAWSVSARVLSWDANINASSSSTAEMPVMNNNSIIRRERDLLTLRTILEAWAMGRSGLARRLDQMQSWWKVRA